MIIIIICVYDHKKDTKRQWGLELVCYPCPSRGPTHSCTYDGYDNDNDDDDDDDDNDNDEDDGDSDDDYDNDDDKLTWWKTRKELGPICIH